MKKRAYYGALDIAKYISAFLVAAIHIFPFIDFSQTFNTLFIGYVCRLAVPFFFAASAFLHFKKRKADNLADLKRYEVRIGLLYLAWSMIYLPYILIDIFSGGNIFMALVREVRDFFLMGSYYHLWFLPALMLGMFLVVEMLRHWKFSTTAITCLILYFIGYLINIFGSIWMNIPGINLLYNLYMEFFGTARNGIFFAPIFLLIGYMLAEFKKPGFKTSLLCFIASWLFLIMEVSLYFFTGLLQDLSSMFLFLVPTTYFLLCCLVQIRVKKRAVYAELRKESTIIYTSHILFSVLLFMITSNHLLVYLLTLALSSALAFVIIRFSKKIPILRLFY